MLIHRGIKTWLRMLLRLRKIISRKIATVLAALLIYALFSFSAISQDKSEYTVLIKSANGRVLINNGKNIFFTIELKGENIGQANTIFQMFITVDGRPI